MTLDAPVASRKPPIISASVAMPAPGNSSIRMPSARVASAETIFQPKPSSPRWWNA